MSTNFKMAAQDSKCLKASRVERPTVKKTSTVEQVGLGILVFKNN